MKGIQFFPEDAGPNSSFWGWYADTNCPGTFGDETVAGFRLRKANIGIGLTDRMTEIFAEAAESYARFNKYFMGEIHIQNLNVIPNARRDGFEEGPEWDRIRKELVEFAHTRSREAYQLSQARNLDIERLVGAAEKERESAEKKITVVLASKDEKTKILNKINKVIDKLDESKKADRSENERNEIEKVRKQLQNTRDIIENDVNFTTQNLNPALDKKQRKIISDIISIIYNVLDESSFELARDAILAKYQVTTKREKP